LTEIISFKLQESVHRILGKMERERAREQTYYRQTLWNAYPRSFKFQRTLIF